MDVLWFWGCCYCFSVIEHTSTSVVFFHFYIFFVIIVFIYCLFFFSFSSVKSVSEGAKKSFLKQKSFDRLPGFFLYFKRLVKDLSILSFFYIFSQYLFAYLSFYCFFTLHSCLHLLTIIIIFLFSFLFLFLYEIIITENKVS